MFYQTQFNLESTKFARRRVGRSCIALLIIVLGASIFIASPAWASSSVFQVKPPSAEWRPQVTSAGMAVHGVSALYSKAAGKLELTVVRDPRSDLYADLATYMHETLPSLSRYPGFVFHTAKMRKNKAGLEFVDLRYSVQDKSLVQAVFFKPGAGIFIVTGTASRQQFRAGEAEFESFINSARYL